MKLKKTIVLILMASFVLTACGGKKEGGAEIENSVQQNRSELFTYGKLKGVHTIIQGGTHRKVISEKGVQKICMYLSDLPIYEDATSEKFVGGLNIQLISEDRAISFSLGKKLMYKDKVYTVPDGTVEQVGEYMKKYCE